MKILPTHGNGTRRKAETIKLIRFGIFISLVGGEKKENHQNQITIHRNVANIQTKKTESIYWCYFVTKFHDARAYSRTQTPTNRRKNHGACNKITTDRP